jgi:hypothetical protein
MLMQQLLHHVVGHDRSIGGQNENKMSAELRKTAIFCSGSRCRGVHCDDGNRVFSVHFESGRQSTGESRKNLHEKLCRIDGVYGNL